MGWLVRSRVSPAELHLDRRLVDRRVYPAIDIIHTEQGDDLARGAGGNDKLIDLSGTDYLIGGAGNDVFDAREEHPFYWGNDPDSISGGSGTDAAFLDDVDGRASIEQLLT